MMIKRYQTPAIGKIWSESATLAIWLKIELLVCQAWTKFGLISEQDYQAIATSTTVDVAIMNHWETITQHDVVAFLKMLNQHQLPSHKWIHFGLTSGDLVETTYSLQIKQSLMVVFEAMHNLLTSLKSKADQYKWQLIMGRTHGIFAEPISLGLKFAYWYDEINRHLGRLQWAMPDVTIAKIAGTLGNFIHVQPVIEQFVADELALSVANVNNQIISRDRLAFFWSLIANLATSLEKIAIEIRLWQRSEINEAQEPFLTTQTGSSSLPHKKNPIFCENICSLARLIRSNCSVTFENNLLWNERDISNSANERIIFPDTFHLIHFALIRMNHVIDGLQINVPNINKNIARAHRSFFSQRILLALIAKTNVTREKIYDFIQTTSFQAIDQQQDYRLVLEEHHINDMLDQTTLNELFDQAYFLNNLDHFYQKIFK